MSLACASARLPLKTGQRIAVQPAFQLTHTSGRLR